MNKNKKILFTGGSHAEIPMIEEAKKSGFFVITTGTNRDGLGHKLADEYIYGDFSDKDFVYKLAKEKKVDAIVSGCNDFAYISTAYACEKLGLKGHDSYDTAMLIHHKDSFRKITNSLNIRTPKNYNCSNENELLEILNELDFPIIIKPIDLTGGKGVKICSSKDEALKAYRDAIEVTREKHIIVEEYISGTNHGASFILKNKKVLYKVFDNEQYYINKYLVSGASMPGDVSEVAKVQLIKDVEKIAKYLNLVDGLFHFQFIIENKSNAPIIIDPCRRAPGDLYVLLAKYASGINYPKEILNAEIGSDIREDYIVECNFIARECIMPKQKGIIKNIYMSDLVNKHMIYKLVWGNKSDIVNNEMKYKAGILILSFDSSNEMNDTINEWNKHVYIEMLEG